MLHTAAEAIVSFIEVRLGVKTAEPRRSTIIDECRTGLALLWWIAVAGIVFSTYKGL